MTRWPPRRAVDHRRDERLDDVDRSHQVDVDHRFPVLMGELVDGPPRRDARRCSSRRPCAGWLAWISAANARHLVVVGDVQHAVLGHLRHPARGRRRRSSPGPRRRGRSGTARRPRAASLQRGRPADAAGGPGEKATLARETARLRHGGDDTDRIAAQVGATPQRVQPQPLEHIDGAIGIVAAADERAVVRTASSLWSPPACAPGRACRRRSAARRRPARGG